MERDTERVERLVRACLGDWTVAGMERLGGMTNRSYHVTARRRADGAVQELAVRLPGPGAGQTQRRGDEARSMALACELGIDADLYYFDQRTGEKVAVFLPDVQTLHPADLRREELLEGIARVLANQVLMDYLWGLWGAMRAPWEGEALARYARSRWRRMQANLRRLPRG